MKFLKVLAIGTCAALSIIAATTFYGCNNTKENTGPVILKDSTGVNGELFTTVKLGKDTFYLDFITEDIHDIIKSGKSVYLYNVYSRKNGKDYVAISEIPLATGNREILDNDTVDIKSLYYKQ